MNIQLGLEKNISITDEIEKVRQNKRREKVLAIINIASCADLNDDELRKLATGMPRITGVEELNKAINALTRLKGLMS
jgi:hypothetical protein